MKKAFLVSRESFGYEFISNFRIKLTNHTFHGSITLATIDCMISHVLHFGGNVTNF
jgi:hypothetical protein